MKRVLEAIPWIRDCCKARILPKLFRIILYVDAKYGNEMISRFTENMGSLCWVKSLSRSLVTCDNINYSGSHFLEHTFKISDSYKTTGRHPQYVIPYRR